LNDGLIESVAPILSPHLSKLELLLIKVGQFEETFMNMVPGSPVNANASSNLTGNNHMDSIVEMVTNPMCSAPIAPIVASATTSEIPTVGISTLAHEVIEEIQSDDDYVFAEANDSSVGLRKRK